MPTPQARAAYADAMKLMRSMRDLHEREAALLLESQVEHGSPASRAILVNVELLRSEWADLFKEYSEAMARYTSAIEEVRGPRA